MGLGYRGGGEDPSGCGGGSDGAGCADYEGEEAEGTGDG